MTSDWMHDDPERAAMSTLSDMLGIPHFTTSRGSTVRGDFITAVARALGARDEDFLRSPDHPLMPGRPGKNKDEILALAWELARQEPMPEDMISSGETITDAHLEGIIDGVVRNGVSPLLEDDTSEGGFHSMEDHRRRQVAERAVRDGQWAFRDAVFDAYGEGATAAHDGKTWESLIPGNVWEPGVSGWREVVEDGGAPPEWAQPTGAHDAYITGDLETFKGTVYRSKIDANVWSPEAYPAGWEQVEG